MGANTYRSHFNRELAQIFINLDHPQIAGALQLGGIESRGFRDVTYEVAIVEYAQAISFVHLEKLGDLYATSEALFDVKETIERLSRKVAGTFGYGQKEK